MSLARSLCFLSVVALTGCASVTSLQTARPIGVGKTQFALEPGTWGVSSGNSETDVATLPRVDLSVRHGVSDTVEIGGRLGAGGVELLSKFALSPPGSGVAVAVAPSVGGIVGLVPGSGLAFVTIQVPLLIGVPFGEGSEFVFGPRVHNVFLGAAGTVGVNILSLGGSAGVSLKVSDSFRLFPEFAVVYPVVGAASALGSSSATSDFGDGVIFQLALGLIFGAPSSEW